MNVYDQANRYAVRGDPIGFFRWALPGLDPALAFRGWLDTRTLPFPGAPDRVCDTVADFATTAPQGPRWAAVLEFQTEPAPDMLDRLLEYLARLRRELRHGPRIREKYQVVAALVNLTGPPQPDTLEMAFPGLPVPSLRLRVLVRTLRDEDAAATLASIAVGQTSRCLLSWISLMRGAAESSIIELWKQVASTEPDAKWRAAYGALALVFAELAGCTPQWRAGLEGWNVRESSVVAEWKAEGKAEGKVESKRTDLLRLLELRFSGAVPAELVTAVESQADLDLLATWFDCAVLADSLEAFRAAIGR